MPQPSEPNLARPPRLIQELIRALAKELGLVNALITLVIHERRLTKVIVKPIGTRLREGRDEDRSSRRVRAVYAVLPREGRTAEDAPVLARQGVRSR